MMITETTVPRRLRQQPRGVESTFCGGVLVDELTPACVRPTKAYPEGRTGTDAGFQAHHAAKEPVCDPCAEARRTVVNARRARPETIARRKAEYQGNRD